MDNCRHHITSCTQTILLYSWRFSRYSAAIHWLDHGDMTSNNATVSRQMPWAGNIAKTMTSTGKQLTVTREMLTAVARDRWNFSAVFKFCFCFVLLYNKSLNDWSLGEQWILFPSNLNVSWDESRETKFAVPRGTSHQVFIIVRSLLFFKWRKWTVHVHFPCHVPCLAHYVADVIPLLVCVIFPSSPMHR